MRPRLLWAYGLLLVIALGSYALLGWHVRMLADDYCLAAVGQAYGPIGAVQYWYQTWNGLYALNFISGLIAWSLPEFVKVQTTALLLMMIAALWFGFQQIAAALKSEPLKRSSLLVALLLTLVLVYTLPNPTLLYWHSVILCYSLSVGLILWAAGAVIRYIVHGWKSTSLYTLFLTAITIVAVGSANTYFLPLFGIMILAALYTVWRVPVEKRRPALLMITVVGVTALVAFAFVFTAPGNAVRQAQVFETSGYTTPPIGELIILIIQNVWSYLTFPYPYTVIYALVAFGVGIVIALALGVEDAGAIACLPLSAGRAWLDALTLVVLSIGVTLATIATTTYGVGTVVWHTMSFPRVVQALCMVALGYMLVVWLARRGFPSAEIKRRPAYRAVRLALIGLMVALPLGALANNLSRLPNFQAYAQDWDKVHAMILAEVAAGNRGLIDVPAYRYSVAALLNLDELDEPLGYTRGCAASFYGVENIIMPRMDVD